MTKSGDCLVKSTCNSGYFTYSQKHDCNDNDQNNHETRCPSSGFELVLGSSRKLLGCPLGIYSESAMEYTFDSMLSAKKGEENS